MLRRIEDFADVAFQIAAGILALFGILFLLVGLWVFPAELEALFIIIGLLVVIAVKVGGRHGRP